ncbi:NlpC/P60 family protein [Methylosoma difficile]
MVKLLVVLPRPRILVVLALASLCACTSNPPETAAPVNPSLVGYALSLKGAPYRYGKDNPREGFDCSGFVRHVYQRQGIKLPRTAKAMAENLPEIDDDEIHAGDLLFFNIGGRPYSHVGIYLDDGKFIHAPSQRTGKVMVSNVADHYWQRCYSGARRPPSKH